MSDATATAAPAAQPGTWKDPYRAYHFKLSFEDNLTEAHLPSVEGLGVDIDRIEYRPAGSNSHVIAVPGQVTYPPVRLCYGLSDSTNLWDWLMTAVDGNVKRRNVTIAVLQSDGSRPALSWSLEHAWPMGWSGAPLATLSREIAIETLTLAHEGLKRESTVAGATGAAPGAPGR